MKNLYTLVFLLIVAISQTAHGQSPSFAEWNSRQILSLKKGNTLPVLGISVSVPLFKHYTQRRQLNRFKLPERPSLPDIHAEEPIAFETTGEEVVIYVSGNNNRPSYTLIVGGETNNYTNVPFDYSYFSNGGGSSSTAEEPPGPVVKAKKFRKDDCPNGQSIYKQM